MARRGHTEWRRRRGGTGVLLLYRVFTVLVVCGCVLTALTMFFRVRQVTVTGMERYTEEEIQEAAGVALGDNLFLMNKYTMAADIGRKLPYIEATRIHRTLPDTLVIEVRECARPLALVQDGQTWLVSSTGKLVDCLDGTDTEGYGTITGCSLLLPEVGGRLTLAEERAAGTDGGDSTEEDALVTTAAEKQESLLSLIAALGDRHMLVDTDGVRLDGNDWLCLDYAERFTVKLPYGADYAYKLRALTAYLESGRIQENMTGTFDMTKDDKNHFTQNVR